MRSPDLRFIRRDIKNSVHGAKDAVLRPKFPSVTTMVSAAGAAACVALCVAVLKRSNGVGGILTDGRHIFSAGSLVHEEALFGIFVSALSFVAIMVGQLMARHFKVRVATFSAAFVMMSVLCLALTISTYRQFG